MLKRTSKCNRSQNRLLELELQRPGPGTGSSCRVGIHSFTSHLFNRCYGCPTDATGVLGVWQSHKYDLNKNIRGCKTVC